MIPAVDQNPALFREIFFHNRLVSCITQLSKFIFGRWIAAFCVATGGCLLAYRLCGRAAPLNPLNAGGVVAAPRVRPVHPPQPERRQLEVRREEALPAQGEGQPRLPLRAWLIEPFSAVLPPDLANGLALNVFPEPNHIELVIDTPLRKVFRLDYPDEIRGRVTEASDTDGLIGASLQIGPGDMTVEIDVAGKKIVFNGCQLAGVQQKALCSDAIEAKIDTHVPFVARPGVRGVVRLLPARLFIKVVSLQNLGGKIAFGIDVDGGLRLLLAALQRFIELSLPPEDFRKLFARGAVAWERPPEEAPIAIFPHGDVAVPIPVVPNRVEAEPVGELGVEPAPPAPVAEELEGELEVDLPAIAVPVVPRPPLIAPQLIALFSRSFPEDLATELVENGFPLPDEIQPVTDAVFCMTYHNGMVGRVSEAVPIPGLAGAIVQVKPGETLVTLTRGKIRFENNRLSISQNRHLFSDQMRARIRLMNFFAQSFCNAALRDLPPRFALDITSLNASRDRVDCHYTSNYLRLKVLLSSNLPLFTPGSIAWV